MRKRTVALLICFVMFALSGCKEEVGRYKRISFEGETLGEELKCITADTKVINKVDEIFQEQLPIYEIEKRPISENEFELMQKALGIEKWYHKGLENGEIHSLIAPYNDPVRGDFSALNLSDEELEKLAWDTFNKIPFMEGEYEYLGTTANYTSWSLEDGEIVNAVVVSFRRLIDGVRVIGNEVCDLTFDGSGLQEMHISLYNYEIIGTMDMVALSEAEARVKEPDAFSIEKEGTAKILQVDRVKLLLVNQYSRGCEILQPLYNFIGTVSFEDGSTTEFSSKVIAIPEEMTYEEE